MAEMARDAKVPDRSKETRQDHNTDYQMDNVMILRIHEGRSVYLAILRPGAREQRLAEIKNVSDSDTRAEILVRQRIYEVARGLQPSSMQALAAIRDTVTADAREEGIIAPMTPPRTPRPTIGAAPRTPFPFPMAAAPMTPSARPMAAAPK